MRLSNPQRGVALGVAAGVVVTGASFAIALANPPGAGIASLESRLHLLVLSGLGPALALAACIARMANHRFRSPEDLDGGGLTVGSARAKLLQALLQNTLEQLALALPVYGAWALLGPAHMLSVLPTAAGLFVVGRVLFFWGYARGAPGRTLGFALTFYPTAILLVAVLIAAASVAGS